MKKLMVVLVLLVLCVVPVAAGPVIPEVYPVATDGEPLDQVYYLADYDYRPGAVTWVIECWNMRDEGVAEHTLVLELGTRMTIIDAWPASGNPSYSGNIVRWETLRVPANKYSPSLYFIQATSRAFLPLMTNYQ